jgi:hypothetical protein
MEILRCNRKRRTFLHGRLVLERRELAWNILLRSAGVAGLFVPNVAMTMLIFYPAAVLSNALAALNSLADTQQHEARVTPPEKVDEWLPWVHVVISVETIPVGNLPRSLFLPFARVSQRMLLPVQSQTVGISIA